MIPRVLVVDDSSYVRLAVARALQVEGIDVVGFAADGQQAVEQHEALHPDVVVLDLQMPRMSGVEAIRRMRQTRDTPILIFASMDASGAAMAVEALAEGAADLMAKPARGQLTYDVAARVWALATARAAAEGRIGERAPAARLAPLLVVVAASTGGPACLERLLAGLPSDFPVPILIAQHMPAGFTNAFAHRLDAHSELSVFEGAEGDAMAPGTACVLPGGTVSTVHASKGGGPAFSLHVGGGERLSGAKPNATALFLSAVGAASGRVCAVVLTGMGADGADAVPAIVAAGGQVIAQDPDEAMMASMPNAAITAGAQRVGTLARIPELLRELVVAPEGPPA